MIPDEDDDDGAIDLSWFYFIGRTKLGLTIRETGRLTITLFNKLYKHYKNTFDFEMMLRQTGTTYAEAYKKSNDAELWF